MISVNFWPNFMAPALTGLCQGAVSSSEQLVAAARLAVAQCCDRPLQKKNKNDLLRFDFDSPSTGKQYETSQAPGIRARHDT